MPIKAGDIFVSFPGDAHGMVNTSDEDFIMLGFATQCLLISINTKAKMNDFIKLSYIKRPIDEFKSSFMGCCNMSVITV